MFEEKVRICDEGLKKVCDERTVGRGEEICKKYRDLKFACLDGEEDENSPFFVNIQGKPLSKIRNHAGSLLEKLGTVCRVEKPTVNTFR